MATKSGNVTEKVWNLVLFARVEYQKILNTICFFVLLATCYFATSSMLFEILFRLTKHLSLLYEFQVAT